MSPWTDLAATGASITSNAANDVMVCKEDLLWMAGMYFGKNDPKTPLVSPLYADLSRLPPLLVQVGSAEILLDDATRTTECARAAGVQVELEVWEEMLHGWHLFAKLLPEGQQAINRRTDSSAVPFCVRRGGPNSQNGPGDFWGAPGRWHPPERAARDLPKDSRIMHRPRGGPRTQDRLNRAEQIGFFALGQRDA